MLIILSGGSFNQICSAYNILLLFFECTQKFISLYRHVCVSILIYEKINDLLMAMPHGSAKSPVKNRNEIRHSLCMPYSRDKSW